MKKNDSFMEITMNDSTPQLPTPNKLQTLNAQSRQKPYDIRVRTFEFAIRMLAVVGTLPKEGFSATIADQLSRCGTSVGANTEEADGAVTKADKRRTLVVARKELREARYWLRIIDRIWGGQLQVRQDIEEATELLNILSTIIMKLA
jgi:four helix bundle protein